MISKRKTTKTRASGKPKQRSVTRDTIAAWDDDPMSHKHVRPQQRPIPEWQVRRFAIDINESQPIPKVYKSGTPEFRYWNAVDAFKRTIEFWSEIIPEDIDWVTGSLLNVNLSAGEILNACYERETGL